MSSEQRLAAEVMKWLNCSESYVGGRMHRFLEQFHFEIFQEVTLPNEGGRADIVVRFGKYLWCIETKTSASLQLLDQMIYRRPYFHFISCAVPYTRNRADSFRYVCNQYGFGVIAVHVKHKYVEEESIPFINRKVWQSIDFSNHVDGSAGSTGDYYTPWRNTCLSLLKYVEANEGCFLADALRNITHHYRDDKRAKAAMSQWLHKGKVKGVRTIREGRYVRLYTDFKLIADV